MRVLCQCFQCASREAFEIGHDTGDLRIGIRISAAHIDSMIAAASGGKVTIRAVVGQMLVSGSNK